MSKHSPNTKHGIIAGLTAIIIAVAIVGGAYWYMSGGLAVPAVTDDTDQPDITANPNLAQPAVSSNVKIGIAPYTLVDVNGKTITEKSFPDKYKLVFFGFTHCTDVCPIALQTMTRALANMGADAAKIQPLFVSVDPRHDTSKVMKDYLKNFSSAILGAAGTAAQVKAAEDSFKVYASPGMPQASSADAGTEDDHDEAEHHHQNDGDSDDADAVGHSDNIYLLKPGNGFVNVFNGDVDTGTLTAALKTAVGN